MMGISGVHEEKLDGGSLQEPGWRLLGSEIILCDEDRVERPVPARDIWENEKTQSGQLPLLSSVGLTASNRMFSPILRLTPSEKSECGVLRLAAKSIKGEIVDLSFEHRSNHVVAGRRWVAFYDGSLEEVFSALASAGLALGVHLNLRDYLTCVKSFADKPWFQNEVSVSASTMADSAHREKSMASSPLFTGTLSDYQEQGSSWLCSMADEGVGVILGDGMGLGKTIQVIRLICDILTKDPAARILVICPSALIENWVREIDKFSRGISVQRHVGPGRTGDYHRITGSVVITSYDTARIDSTVFSQITWDLVALDEAQYIKNPNSKRARSIKEITRKIGVAITGTPFENHMTDVWSLVDFCIPGFLGPQDLFSLRFPDEEASAEELGEIVAPLLLRRRLQDVTNSLPEMIPIPVPICLEAEEATEYQRRKEEYSSEGASLGAIVKLTTDLSLSRKSDDGISDLKYEYLATVTEEVFGYGEKIIVFAERNKAIARIAETYVREVPVFTLTGETPVEERQLVVDRFSDVDGAAMLICNPAVGGAGLNITAANHVLHFSMQWNPAKIDQADARAHRRGQTKPVTVHYPYYASTVEEYMWDAVARKRGLAEQVTVGNKATSDHNEIIAALSLSPMNQ